MHRTLAALAAVLTLAAAPAFAGIADSPLPELEAGKTTVHLYSVPFVTRGGGLETIFACTSTDTVPIRVGIEVFYSIGVLANDAAATSLVVNPGVNVQFGTSATIAISIDSNLGANVTSGGSARILATSKKVVCTAFLMDAGNAPPTSMVSLTIIAKTKQKAAN